MRLDKELLQQMAREMLNRTVPADVAADSAGRLETILDWVNGTDEARLGTAGPAGLLDLTRAGWRVEPPKNPAYATVRPTGRGSGYGAPPKAYAQQPDGAAPAGTVAGEGKSGFADRPPAGLPLPDGPLGVDATTLAGMIRRGEVTSSEVVAATLGRIAVLNPVLNAYLTVTGEPAMAQAEEADRARARGELLGPLHGVPVAIKDIIETAGVRTTCGSKILANHIPVKDATVVRKLREAGAIILGKTNTHEFAFGPTTVNPHYGACRNPHNPACVSGGSSGGSAVALASGQAHLALGTDTGGSIRIPAACCGIVGLKPTYGRVSKAGIFPLSWSLDHAGPLARTVADVALAFTVLAGHDPGDPSTVAAVPAGNWADAARQPGNLAGMRAGIPRGWDSHRVSAGVAAGFREAVTALVDLGVDVHEIEFPAADAMMLANRLLVLAEAAAYHLPMLRERPNDYGPDVRARLELGQYLTAAHYITGQRLRGELCQAISAAMEGVDVLLTPALPVPAPYIGQDNLRWSDGEETVPDALIRFPAPFNVTGQPALSLPCGFEAGRPVGLQIVGRPFDEAVVLRIGAALERSLGISADSAH